MAITQKTGALANAGAQAQSVASTLANLAANLHYTGGGGGGGQPQKSYGQEPVYYAPAPVNTYWPPQQTGSFSSGSSAAAAQHLLTQARNQQQIKQNVFNDVAKQAVLTALAVATGQQPGRSVPQAPTLLQRQANGAQAHQLTPQQESQLFDQQIQATKLAASQQGMPGVYTPDPVQQQRIAAINRQVEQMQAGFTNARPNPRLTQEGQVLSAFPQMTPQQLRTRSGSQLQAMLDLAKQPPASAAGSSDQVGGQETSPNPMTHNQPPVGPPPQPAYSPLPTWDTTRGAPAQPPYNPLPTGPAMVSAAFTDALNRGQVTGQTQGGQMADGGGGFWGSLLDAGLGYLGLLNPINAISELIDKGGDAWGALTGMPARDILKDFKDTAAPTYEAAVDSPPGHLLTYLFGLLDWPRQKNVDAAGDRAYEVATGDMSLDVPFTDFAIPGGKYVLPAPDQYFWSALFTIDPKFKDVVVDAHEHGYSSPGYIKVAESQGIDWRANPEFTGGQAVWEATVGYQTDDKPFLLKYGIRMMLDVIYDPLTMAAGVSEVSQGIAKTGAALRALDDAGIGTKIAGGALEGLGRAGEIAARLPDAIVEAPIKGLAKGGGKIGEVTGLLSPSTEAQRAIARAETATAGDLIQAARESVPESEGRVFFDAEAQGVTPTSGPELIETPVRTEAPTLTAREGGEATVTRSTGTATVDRPSDVVGFTTAKGSTYEVTPSGTTIRTKSVHPEHPGDVGLKPESMFTVYVKDWEDVAMYRMAMRNTDAAIRDQLMTDWFKTVSRTPEVGLQPFEVWADGSRHLGNEITELRRAPSGAKSAAPSANETALADVNKQIKAAQADLRSSNPDKMMVATEKIRLLNVERARLRGEITAENAAKTARPVTKRERDAAAAAQTQASASTAANTPPTMSRNPSEAQVVTAADHAKTVDPKRTPMKPADRKKFPAVANAEDRYRRLVKEDREGLPKEVSAILRKQEPGEHEFSPIYGGDRPIDRIVTDAIDSKDPAKLAQAEQLVKRLDAKVETELRPDAFYQTWKNGGAPVYLQDDPRFTDAFFEQMRALDPTADPKRLRTLANGLAKGVLDDIAMVQFQLDQVVPLIRELYPDASLDGIFGKVGRAERRDFKDESAAWLIREYLLTNDPARADTILHRFLVNPDELPIIADGIHQPYAHSVPAGYETESLARLTQMREQATAMKRAEQLRDGSLSEVSMAPFREPDVAAQFAGGLKGSSKSFGESLRAARSATRHTVTTDAMVEAAIGEIRDPQLRWLLLNGDGKLTVEMAQVADRMLPESWRPPNYLGDKTSWNVREALDALAVTKETDPAFDLNRARDEVAELGAGLTPKRTAAELASMRNAARAQGLDPKLITNGASTMERATATRLVRAIDKYLSYWRQLRLFNIVTGLPNRIGDQLGNMTTLALRGDPIDVLRYVPASAKSTKTLRASGRNAHRALEAMVLDSPIMRETGQTFPADLIPGKVLNDIERSGLPVYNDLLKGTPAGVRATANLATVPLLKDVTVAGEMAGRKIAFESVYAETLGRESLPAFKEWLRSAHPTQADAMLTEIERLAKEKGGRGYSGYFSPGDVVAATGDQQAGRIWQRELNRAAQKGKAEANRLFFNNVNTNLDEIARRTFTFHFWMTRATALYGRTVLRNPALLNGVYRMWQRAEAISREQGLPDWLATMFKFYQSPTGMYAAFSPIGALFPTFFLDAYSQEGNKFQALQNLLNPLFGGALGAIGLTQNIPDVTGTRNIERFIVDMGNFLKGEGIPLESVPFFGQYINQDSLQLTIPTEEFTKLVLQKANDLLGEPLGTFTPFDRQANEEDQLYSMGEQIAVGLWGPDIQNWTPAQIQELTDAVHQAQYGDGDETWLSETIRAAYGREGGARAGFSLLIPGGVVTRQQFRDDQIKAASEYWDAFYTGQPTTTAGESAAIGRQLATSANPAWIAMNDAYYQIGTKQEQTMYSSVNDMLYSPEDLNPKQSIIIDNGNGSYTVYSMSQLAGLSDKDRRTVVNAWLDQNTGVRDAYTKVQTGRDQFKAAHPDYAQYAEYQSGVYGYSGGPAQFRKDMQDNPTFQAAEEDERQRLKKEGKSGAVLEAELDHWATTQQAFFAATGKKYKRDDVIHGTPGPSSVAAMFSLRDDEDPSPGDGASAAPKDPNIDDYWSPQKGVPRLEQDQAQYAYDNAEMERRFGPYWNQATADWENNADSAKERDNLGIGDKTYVLPNVSETMRRYEAWEEDHPGGSPEEFFTEMLQTEGFGKVVGGNSTPTLPGGTTISSPPGVAAYPLTAAGQLQAVLQRLGLGR